ncbi:MAG TPA: ABC transporter permease [Vicinamibacterales bacterium]|nr:ABC transporter permease [Vicinamibacterales bacterium]
MGTFTRDLRHGIRQLLQSPGFAAAAIGSLALGVGLNVTIFSVVNAVLLRSHALERPDRLVEIYSGVSKDYPQLTTSYPDLQDIQRGADALSGLAASSYVRGIVSTGGKGALVTGETITSNFFRVLGIPIPMGREFRDDENLTADASPVIIVSHGFWQRSLGGSPGVIGSTVRISGVEYTVVGVAPRQFKGTVPGIAADFWVPLMMVDRFSFSGVQSTTDRDPGTSRLTRRGSRWLIVKGRLKDGRTIEEARAQLETIYARLRNDYPLTNKDVTVSVVPATEVRFHPMLDGYFQAASGGLALAVALVLLIACGNVAGLLLARASARRRELAIRAAIGASRGRLIRQLLAEGLVLAGAGGILGVAIAWWASSALQGLLSTDAFPIPVSFDFAIDGTVLLFALAASVITALVFGLAPAWSASRPELVPALKASAEGDERTRFSTRDLLVLGQVTLSTVLLVAGALLARGLIAAQSTDLGYDPRPLSSLTFNLAMNGYDEARGKAFLERAVESLRALPGVVAVSTASRLPLSPDINMDGVRIPGHHTAEEQETPIDTVAVGADYFTTVGVPIVAGRAFTRDDSARQRRVLIVNETFARQYWPDGNALGQRIYRGGYDTPAWEIVGIARDHKVRSVGENPRPYMHLPDQPDRGLGLVVRTATPAESALPMLRNALWSLEPDIVFTEDMPAEQVAATTVLPTRVGAIVLGAFGILALILAAIGLYGVVAYSVSRRTREIGIRMALGAPRAAVLRLLASRGVVVALAGLALGGLLGAAAGRLLTVMLYGISAFDGIAFAIAAAVLLSITGIANLVPTLSAMKIDPVRALRSE